MFDFVRTHSRIVLGIMVLLIFPSFVFFGIQGYTDMSSGAGATVAKVDGQDITQGEWDQAHQRNIERLRRQMPNVDAALLESPQMKRETLDGLVRQRVLLSAANRMNLVPDDNRLQRLFITDPQFATLRNPDGSVNRELLLSQGMSSEAFAQQLRQEFGMQQVLAAVGQSSFAAPSTAAPALDALLQRRAVQLQRFSTADYRSKVNPTDADIAAWYQANQGQFTAPETADIELVQLTLDALMKDVTVPEEDLRRYYDENASRYTATEERRASHILVKAEPDKPAAEKQAAKARAEALLAQVRQNPSSFADVARKSSQDPGSAAQGGDLDFFGRGMMAKPFEDAVFAMKAGEISNVIETDFGFHIIQLVAVRGGDKQPFAAVRPAIEAEVRKTLAQKKYVEAAEQFTNTAYEQPDSLQPLIDRFKLQKTAATVQRTPAPGATGALASPKLLAAVFGTDAVRNKRNTDAIEVAPNQLVAARIVKHTPASTLPLEAVKDRVRERVAATQAASLARQEGARQLAAVKAALATELPAAVTLSRMQMQDQPRQVVDAVLAADASRLPAVLGIDLGEQGYVVARVTQVLGRDAAPGGDAQLQQQYTQAWANAETAAYLESLKKRFKADVRAADPAAAASAAGG